MNAAPDRQQERRRRDGERSRALILAEAARLATVDGIGGLTIGRLADAVGMSKSGLFTLFGSKEDLQLATVDAAADVFVAQVTGPASASQPGLDRVRALADSYLAHVESGTFPGGCFFASVATEVAMQPGPVRDRLTEFLTGWVGLLESAVRAAQQAGTVDPGADAAQVAFEVQAALYLANLQYVLSQDHAAIERGRRAVRERLDRAAPGRSFSTPEVSG